MCVLSCLSVFECVCVCVCVFVYVCVCGGVWACGRVGGFVSGLLGVEVRKEVKLVLVKTVFLLKKSGNLFLRKRR